MSMSHATERERPAARIGPFGGWERTALLSNGAVELAVTLEVGPRVLRFAPPGREGPFQVYADQAGTSGEPEWRNRGGHRLWVAPEDRAYTYAPDNAAVEFTRAGPGTFRFTAPVDAAGWRKSLAIAFPGDDARVVVRHEVENAGAEPRRVAAWGLTVLNPGGIAVAPLPPPGEHPRDLLPDRQLTFWPYSNLDDPRWAWGRNFVGLRQDPDLGPNKFGLASSPGWAAYLWEGLAFVKRFGSEPGRDYPDRGCNCEVFTNRRMLELESLGPLETVPPGGRLVHVERWELRPVDPAISADVAALAAFVAEVTG
jgi:hypothetical protein